jgi:exosortase
MPGSQESTAESMAPSRTLRSTRFTETVLVLLVVAAGWAVAIWHLSLEWTLSAQYQYGWAVPALVLYLVWLRWADRPAAGWRLGARATQAVFIAGACVMGVGILIREANPDWRLLGGWLSAAAIGLTFTALARFGGRPWVGHFAFPILFFLTAVPWPRPQEGALMVKLMSGNARLAAEVLRWCGHEAMVQGNLVALPAGVVGVDEACSGIRSLQGALMISLFLGELWRLSALRRGLLLLSALGVVLCANALRTTWLGWIVAQTGTAVMERWHDTVGYTMLVAGFLLILGIAAALRNHRATGAMDAPPGPAAPPVGSGRVTMGTALALMIFLASIIGTKAWFAWHEMHLTQAPAWRIALPRTIASYHGQTISERTLNELRFPHTESGTWSDTLDRHWQASFFEWPPGRNGEQTVLVHDPRVCLQAGGMQHLETFADCTWERDDLRLAFEAYRFRSGGHEVFVFNTVTSGVLRSDSGALADRSLSRSSRWRAVAAGLRQLGQRRLEVGIWGAASAEDAQRAFRAFLDDAIQIERVHN